MSQFKITILTLISLSSFINADILLPKIIDSKMILQRETKVPIWGWADQGEKITVSFAGQFKSTKADKNGKWMVELNPLKASKNGASMLIQGKNTIKLSDILVGEVWLASGQSNMEWTFSRIVKAEQEIALKQLENDHIRFFHVEKHLSSAIPLDDTLGRWKKCKKFLRDQQSVSAVAFFFASKLHKELDVPIAILDSNWGGQKNRLFYF